MFVFISKFIFKKSYFASGPKIGIINSVTVIIVDDPEGINPRRVFYLRRGIEMPV